MTSHNNYFLKRYCKTAIWINEGDMCMLGKANEVIGEYEKYFNTSNFQY
jgi:ABC-type polysaccharide/polyol phosphate transport system ATPase subunit